MIILFVIGLLLRLPGLAFDGVYDIHQMIFEWGGAVNALGLAKGFSINYGVLSFAFFGIAAHLAESIPRFWWIPYKLIEIIFESGILFCLCSLLPASKRKLALWMYWLNPWFMIHGAFLGFWEGPFLFFAFLAILRFQKEKYDIQRWFWLGVCLFISASFKPQGLFYFALPIGFYTMILFKNEKSLKPLNYFLGMFITFCVLAFFVMANDRGLWAIPYNFYSAVRAVPNLCNDCINLWRPTSYGIMNLIGQSGHVYDLRLPKILYMLIHFCVTSGVLALVFYFCFLLSKNDSIQNKIYLILTFSAIVIPSLATKAHLNHGYSGLVLLIPLALANKKILAAWALLVVGNFYSHLSAYWLGMHRILPSNYKEYPYAENLINKIKPFVAPSGDMILDIHTQINTWISAHFLHEPIMTIFSAISFLLVLLIIQEFLKLAKGKPHACIE